ncbi:MAG: hypothetical protein RR394_07645, partial [Oscillospiraceae bacterium]
FRLIPPVFRFPSARAKRFAAPPPAPKRVLRQSRSSTSLDLIPSVHLKGAQDVLGRNRSSAAVFIYSKPLR